MPTKLTKLKFAGRGFTLVELAMVIAIMVILSGLAVPRYGRATARYHADAAAKRVAADLVQAQQRARAASGACVVAFTASNGRYSMTCPTVGGVAGSTLTTDLTVSPYKSKVVTATFGGSASISFDGHGIPSAGGTVTVSCGSEQRQITIAAINGAVTIQ